MSLCLLENDIWVKAGVGSKNRGGFHWAPLPPHPLPPHKIPSGSAPPPPPPKILRHKLLWKQNEQFTYFAPATEWAWRNISMAFSWLACLPLLCSNYTSIKEISITMTCSNLKLIPELLFTHYRLNGFPHTIYWKISILILGMSGYVI